MARAGYVYVWGGQGLYKIGWTVNVEGRLQTITQPPFPARLIHTIESDDARALEMHLHQQYHSKRTHGEWFQLTDQDLEALKQKTKMLVSEIEPTQSAKPKGQRDVGARPPASSGNRLTVYIPEDMATNAKIKALREGTSVSAFLREKMGAWLRGEIETPTEALAVDEEDD